MVVAITLGFLFVSSLPLFLPATRTVLETGTPYRQTSRRHVFPSARFSRGGRYRYIPVRSKRRPGRSPAAACADIQNLSYSIQP
jgi:hypothetical protein